MRPVLVPAALVITAGYLFDRLDVGINPAATAAVFAVAFCALAFVDIGWRTSAARERLLDGLCCLAVVGAAFAYFLWLASPSLLPVTIAPDVVHHLMLIDLIQRTHHLPHDPALGAYLAEMTGYTPGSHILTATIAALLRVEAVRVVHAVAALFAALGLGVTYLIALRLLEPAPTGRFHAVVAPVLALVPAAYTLGAFFHFFFFAQIVSQTFALGMLLAVIDWVRGERYALVLFVGLGVAVWLTWPVWLGPPVVTLVFAVAFLTRTRAAWRDAALAVLTLALVAAAYAATHAAAGGILTAAGVVTEPSMSTLPIGFLICAAAGILLCTRRTATSALLVFFVGVIAQGGALALLASVQGSRSLYMPLKMVYLAVPVLAVLGCLALAYLSQWAAAHLPRVRYAARVLGVVFACVLVAGRVPVRRQHGSITISALEAGDWARDHLPSGCVDYFSRYWLTGYWLHFDVLGNPRISERMRTETFEFTDTVGKWIEGRGLPYAFVEDVDAVPRDAREDMTVVRGFGRAAIVRNRRPSTCDGAPPSLWRLVARHEP